MPTIHLLITITYQNIMHQIIVFDIRTSCENLRVLCCTIAIFLICFLYMYFLKSERNLKYDMHYVKVSH